MNWNVLIGKTITAVTPAGDWDDPNLTGSLVLECSDGSRFEIEADCFTDHGCFRLLAAKQ